MDWDAITRFAGGIFNKGKEDPAVTQRKNEIERVTGVKPNLIDPEKDPSLVRLVAPYVSKEWGHSAYANPLNNTIAIPNYQPGERPYTEAHEAGHLSWEDAGPPKLLGVSGRAVVGIGDQTGKPPLLQAIGGALLHFDAAEEDRAERLSAKYGPKLGGDPRFAPPIDSQGRSQYGNMLRQEGRERLYSVIAPVADPILTGLSKVQQWQTQQKQKNLQPQIRDLVLKHRQLSGNSNDITPELIESSNKIDQLQEQYGEGFYEFLGTIK